MLFAIPDNLHGGAGPDPVTGELWWPDSEPVKSTHQMVLAARQGLPARGGDAGSDELQGMELLTLAMDLDDIGLPSDAETTAVNREVVAPLLLQASILNVWPEDLKLEMADHYGCPICAQRHALSWDGDGTMGINGSTQHAVLGSDFSASGTTGTLSEIADYLAKGYWSFFRSNRERSFNFSSTGNAAKNGMLTYNFTGSFLDADGISGDRRVLALEALKYVSLALGIEIREDNSDDADLIFTDNANGAFAHPFSIEWRDGNFDSLSINQARINVSKNWQGGESFLPGYTFTTFVHEIGHVLGLGHSGPYDGGGTYENDAIFSNDTRHLSVMSYWDQRNDPRLNVDRAFPQTFMPADWLALDRIYGPQGFGSQRGFSGNTVYGFNTNITRQQSYLWHNMVDILQGGIPSFRVGTVFTIADGTGNNSLDLSGFSGDQYIDLRPADPDKAYPYFSSILGGNGNLAIAAGTTIRDAIGGGGNDVFIGNEADNRFWGGSGDDMFWDSLGNNVYRGGSGEDRVYFSGEFSDFYFEASSSGSIDLGCIATGDVKTVFDCVDWLYFGGSRPGSASVYTSYFSYNEILEFASTDGPPAPGLALQPGATALDSGRITNNPVLAVSGLISGASWQFSADGGRNWQSGSGSSFALPEGRYQDGQVQVRQILDGAISAAGTSFAGFTIDLTPPVQPSLALTRDTGAVAGVTSDGRITVSGLEAGSRWQYRIRRGGEWGNWSEGEQSTFSLPASAGDGVYGVEVRQFDAAGNVSPVSDDLSFTLKTTPPTPRIARVGQRGRVTAAVNRQQIRGRTDGAHAEVDIFSGQTLLGTATSNRRGRFRYRLTPENIEELGQGRGKRVRIAQIDEAGNLGRSSNARFRINTTRGTNRRDLLVGDPDRRRNTFRWQGLDQTPLNRFDTITNYQVGDRLAIRGNRYRTTLNAVEGRARRLNANQVNRVLGRNQFSADSAAAFRVRGMDGTFIALNDGRPGFQANRDGLIFLEGFALNSNNPVQIV